MKAPNVEGKALEQQRNDRQQEGFADALHRGHQFRLGDDIDGVDVVDPLGPVLIALVHGIDADVAGHALRGGNLTNADRHGRRPGAAPDAALFAIGIAGA